jgi:DNA polymerase-3 subunit delta'
MHHALLLQGPRGLGKLAFAQRAAAALLCESPGPVEHRPCGGCRSCSLVHAGSHPDRLRLSPEEDRSQLDVEQVRQRRSELTLTAHYTARRVVVVDPADALNRHAANTLLKTLEEPPAAVVFLLVSARPATLPATVRSRCVALRFQPPAREDALRWLREQVAECADAAALLQWCGGAPLAALEIAEAGTLEQVESLAQDLLHLVQGRLQPVQAAAGWRASGLRTMLDWQSRLVVQAMRIKAAGTNEPAPLAMQGICSTLDLPRLDRVCEELLELRGALERQLNPGEQLALETLAVAWRDAARASH